jgi:hypothetical protein
MESRPVKIYSVEDVPRLRYIAGIILGDILGLKWDVITDKRKLGKYPVINYSSESIAGSFKVSPAAILFEKGVSPPDIAVSEWKGLPVFFPSSADSDLPFDIFGASFFLVSRYEEYLESEHDNFGRYKASSSLAFRQGFLDIPIIDLWVKEMSKVFLRRFQTLTFKRNDYQAMVTIDTDQPFAYLGKSLFRSIGGLFNDMKRPNGHPGERYRIVRGEEKDPFDVFDYIFENIEKNCADARFFLPVGDHSRYDKNPSWKNDEYRTLMMRIGEKYKAGLHPSFSASENRSMLTNEVSRLKTVLYKEITMSRFHYIRLVIPGSYRDLLDAGISEDYSMGYPEEPGFRAGIARPFNFYDVHEDMETSLKIIPFQIMDATLYQYKNLDPDASVKIIEDLINVTRKAGGLFVSIWHNTSLLDDHEWQGWRRVFEKMLNNQKP